MRRLNNRDEGQSQVVALQSETGAAGDEQAGEGELRVAGRGVEAGDARGEAGDGERLWRGQRRVERLDVDREAVGTVQRTEVERAVAVERIADFAGKLEVVAAAALPGHAADAQCADAASWA